VGGNPFFLQELIKSLVANQLITRRPQAWQLTQSIESAAVPNTLKDLISSRLKTLNLTEHEMKILKIMALLNYSPTYNELSQIISFDASLLERFENLELIKSRIAEDDIVYEIVHALTREVVMESAENPPKLHQLIAEKLEEIHSDNLQAYVSELAYHYAQAGNREKALPYLETAADDAKENYQNEAAITFYDQLLEWLDDDQIEKRIDVLLDKSRVLYTIGERDKCQQVRAGALSLSKEIANSKLIAKSNYFLGIIFTDKGNYEKALEYYKSSLKIYEHLSDKKGKSQVLSRLGNLYYLKGEKDKAIKTLKKSLDICEETKQKRTKSIVLSLIGDIHEGEGNYDSAMKCFEERLSISREIDNQIGIASALGKIAGLYWTKSKYDLATHYYKKQLKIAKQLGDKSHIAMVFFHLGNIDLFKEITDFNSAMNHYKESLKICQELGNKDFISKALSGIANIYWGKGHYEKAIEFYNRNLEIIKEVGNIKSIYVTIGNLGLIYLDKEDYDEAIDHFDQAIKAHRDLNFKYGLTYWLWGKGECLYEKNELQKAKKLAIECIDLSEGLSKPDTIYNAKLLLARCNYSLKETDKALKQFNEMLNHTKNDDQTATIHYHLWRFTHNEEDGKIALDLYKKMYSLTPSITYKGRIDELRESLPPKKEETKFDDKQIEDLDESLVL
jgi:tetratricopeptide (TPR) repeat protein